MITSTPAKMPRYPRNRVSRPTRIACRQTITNAIATSSAAAWTRICGATNAAELVR